MEVYYTRCLIEGNPCFVPPDYGRQQLCEPKIGGETRPTSFHPNQAWIKFSTGQCVREV